LGRFGKILLLSWNPFKGWSRLKKFGFKEVGNRRLINEGEEEKLGYCFKASKGFKREKRKRGESF